LSSSYPLVTLYLTELGNNYFFYNNPATGLIHWSAHDFTLSMTNYIFEFDMADSCNAYGCVYVIRLFHFIFVMPPFKRI
jgi:hypothetical protein